MFLRTLNDSLKTIKGIGPSVIPGLNKLGINNVADLLQHYPREWEDRKQILPLSNFRHSKVCTVVTVVARDYFGFGRTRTLKVYVKDDTAAAVLLCFNRPWLDKQLLEGQQFWLSGRFYYKYGEIQSGSFEIEPLTKNENSDNNL